MTTIPQLPELKKRLYQLEIQKSRYGIAADPHITMEADDLKTVVSQMELIDIHRRNLDQLVRQSSQLAQHVPPHVTNQIISERAEVMRLRQVCARLGQSVPAHPLDDDAEPELPPIKPTPRPAPQTDIRSKLDQIERLLNEIRAAL